MVRDVAQLRVKGNSDRPMRQRRHPWGKVFVAGNRQEQRGMSMPKSIPDDRRGNKDVGHAMTHPAQRQNRSPRHVEPIVQGNRSVAQERKIVIIKKKACADKPGGVVDFACPVAI